MPNNKMASSSLGWALIGCGGAGNNHAQWAMSTPGVEIHGFCDKLIDSAERFHQKYGGSYYTTDPERIFTDSSIDIVSIATSHRSGCCRLQCKKTSVLRKTDGNDHI